MCLWYGRDACCVSNWGVHGPLAGINVAECRVALTPGMAVVGAGGILVLCIIILCAGNGGVRGAVVLQVERAVGDMLRGALLLAVVAGTQLLGLDLGPLLPLAQLTQ